MAANTFQKGLAALESNGAGLKVGIVRAKWNEEVTGNLLSSAVKELVRLGVKKEDISICECPGSYEVVYLAQMLATERKVDAVICLGALIGSACVRLGVGVGGGKPEAVRHSPQTHTQLMGGT